jgi:hypothetical protein
MAHKATRKGWPFFMRQAHEQPCLGAGCSCVLGLLCYNVTYSVRGAATSPPLTCMTRKPPCH